MKSSVCGGLEVGKTVEFLYPAANYLMAPARLERRRLRIDRVRDMAKEPPEPLTLALDPMLRRGRVLVIGQDLDKNAERSFYLESMEGLVADGEQHGGVELAAVIVKGGAEVHRYPLPDPVVGFCREFNRANPDAKAYPISRAIDRASSSRREE